MTRATAIGSALVGLDSREVQITADVEPCDPSEATLVIDDARLADLCALLKLTRIDIS